GHARGAGGDRSRGGGGGAAPGRGVVLGGGRRGGGGVGRAPRCDGVFVDTARTAPRRFCSTSCQNRVKTAAFRAAHRGCVSPRPIGDDPPSNVHSGASSANTDQPKNSSASA